MAAKQKIVTDDDLVNEFMTIELWCDQIKERCYKARKALSERGQVAGSAPSGGAQVFSLEEKMQMTMRREKRLAKNSK